MCALAGGQIIPEPLLCCALHAAVQASPGQRRTARHVAALTSACATHTSSFAGGPSAALSGQPVADAAAAGQRRHWQPMRTERALHPLLAAAAAGELVACYTTAVLLLAKLLLGK